MELKNLPRPRSPSFTTADAVTNTFAGFISIGEWWKCNRSVRRKAHTSVHDSTRVHVVECTAELDKVAPDCLLRNQLLLLLEMLQKNSKNAVHVLSNALIDTLIILDRSPASANSSTMFSCRNRGVPSPYTSTPNPAYTCIYLVVFDKVGDVTNDVRMVQLLERDILHTCTALRKTPPTLTFNSSISLMQSCLALASTMSKI